MLYSLGSGKIQDLLYRCQWYMVTQKGIEGFTPYEKITYSHKNNWADVLDDKLCVPFQSKIIKYITVKLKYYVCLPIKGMEYVSRFEI